MRPPICEVCHEMFDSRHLNQHLIEFKDYKPLANGICGHPDGLGWFCHLHLSSAKHLTHLPMREAIAQIEVLKFKPER